MKRTIFSAKTNQHSSENHIRNYNSDCPDFCEGTTRYYNGSCVDGECVYDATTNSVDCGYVEPEPGETSSQYLIIGGIGLALLSMLNKK